MNDLESHRTKSTYTVRAGGHREFPRRRPGLVSCCGRVAILMACLGLVCPHTTIVFAQQIESGLEDRQGFPVLVDVALDADGLLQGRIFDSQGAPLTDNRVEVAGLATQGVTVNTDQKGWFTVPVQRGGVYQVTSGGGAVIVRAWQYGTAPPRSVSHVTLVAGEEVIRGQSWHPLSALFCNTYVVATLTGVAIAIPVIYYNRRDDRSPASP